MKGDKVSKVEGGEARQFFNGGKKGILLRNKIDVSCGSCVNGSREHAHSSLQNEWRILATEHSTQQPMKVES